VQLRTELDFELSYELVDTPERAEAIQFGGSPTVLVDDVDPFARGEPGGGLSCRIYQTPNGPAGSPSIAQLRQAISAKPGASETE